MADTSTAVSGAAAGVPYTALPPDGDAQKPAPLIAAWHLTNPPRSGAALSAALPLRGVAAWRVYLDLPMHGRRQLPGGLDEFYQLAYQDAVLKINDPVQTQAAAEFPAVLAELRTQLPINDGPIGLIGASAGASVPLQVLAGQDVPVSAVALISAAIQLAEVVAYNENLFSMSYPWTDESRAVAARFDFVARAHELTGRDPQPAMLLVTGEADDPRFPLQAQRLLGALRESYRDPAHLRHVTIPGMKHTFADEPGIDPAPQTNDAKQVDATVTSWFGRFMGP